MLNNATGFDWIYIACGYTDLRQGIDGLCAVIRRQLDIDPFQKNVLFKPGLPGRLASLVGESAGGMPQEHLNMTDGAPYFGAPLFI